MLLNTCINKLRNFYNRVATVCAGVFLSLVFGVAVHAAGIQNVTVNTTFTLSNAQFGGEKWITNSSVDPFATHVQVTSVEIYASNSVRADCTTRLQIVNTALTTFTATNQPVLPSTPTKLTYTFNSASLYMDEIVHIVINSGNVANPCSGSNQYTITFQAGDNSYSYANGFNQTANTTSTKDIYFVVNGGRSTIDFVGTPTSTCSFLNWKVVPQFSDTDTTNCLSVTTTPTNCSIGVAYNSNRASTSTYLFNNNSGNGSQLAGYIPNNYPFVSGTLYSARAYMCNTNNSGDCFMGVGSNNHILAYSDPWDFIVNGLDTCTTTYFSQSEIPPPAGVSSTQYVSLVAQANAQCLEYNDDSILGGVVYGLCKILVTLFVPSQDSLENFSNLRTQVATKPPFGYVSVFSAQISNLSSATSTTSTISNVTSTAAMQLTSIANISVFATVRAVFGWFLWFVFVWYIYSRFKNFSLHG